jgi:hypothetical protein
MTQGYYGHADDKETNRQHLRSLWSWLKTQLHHAQPGTPWSTRVTKWLIAVEDAIDRG